MKGSGYLSGFFLSMELAGLSVSRGSRRSRRIVVPEELDAVDATCEGCGVIGGVAGLVSAPDLCAVGPWDRR
jgi:hypothetical protein